MLRDDDQTVSDGSEIGFQKLGPYEIKGELGEGGMARVYLAWDPRAEREVALKVIKPQSMDARGFRERFRAEARIVASLQHPRITTMYEYATEPQPYIAMEYVRGGTLTSRIDKGALPEREAARIALWMAGGLEYAHQRGVVHRDFKPGNILFREGEYPVISDFGVAKQQGDLQATRASAIVGSKRYMAPEQAQGVAATDRADIYSFGIVFYEMLTGRESDLRPINSPDDRRRVEQDLKGVNDSYVDLICKCLNYESQERPSAQECKAILARQVNSTFRWWPAIVICLGVALLALGLREIFSPAQLPRPPLTWTISTSPPDADLFIDGSFAPTHEVARDDKEHEFIAVKTGFVGQIVKERIHESHPITLMPLGTPSLAEHSRFTDIFYDQSTPPAEPPIEHYPLKTLLQIKAAKGDQQRIAEFTESINTLARHGDQSAQFMMFVAAQEDLIVEDNDVALQNLQQAMQSGYALAGFYYAVYIKATNEPLKVGTAPYEEFLIALDLAAKKGASEIVANYRERMIPKGK